MVVLLRRCGPVRSRAARVPGTEPAPGSRHPARRFFPGGEATVRAVAFTTDPDGTHRYRATCSWSGSTGLGYDRYGRIHRVEAPPSAAALELANDPSLGGDAELLDPEQL